MTEYIGIIEIGEGVLYIEKRDTKLVASTMCNVGMLDHYTQAYSNDFSLDKNLQNFIEWIEEKQIEEGD